MSTAKVRLKKAAVIFKLNISAVNPKMKKPVTKQIPIKPAVLVVEEVDWVERQKTNNGTK